MLKEILLVTNQKCSKHLHMLQVFSTQRKGFRLDLQMVPKIYVSYFPFNNKQHVVSFVFTSNTWSAFRRGGAQGEFAPLGKASLDHLFQVKNTSAIRINSNCFLFILYDNKTVVKVGPHNTSIHTA